jgi:hypothetical protein
MPPSSTVRTSRARPRCASAHHPRGAGTLSLTARHDPRPHRKPLTCCRARLNHGGWAVLSTGSSCRSPAVGRLRGLESPSYDQR